MAWKYEIVDSYEIGPNVMGGCASTFQYQARQWVYYPVQDYTDYHSVCHYCCGVFKPSTSYELLYTEISQFAYGQENNPGIESVGPVTAELLLADENYQPIGSVLSVASFPELLDPGTGSWMWTGGSWSNSITLDPSLWYCIRLTRFTPVSLIYRELYIGSCTVSSPNNKFLYGGVQLDSKYLPYPEIPYPPPWVLNMTSYSFIFRNYANVWTDKPDNLPDFVPSRPDDYDPDLPWLPDEWDGDTYTPSDWGDSTDYVATGGGRWGQNLVVAGNKKIYYEAFEGI